MRLAVIVPMDTRAQGIEESLLALADLRRRGHQVIVVDAGDGQSAVARAQNLADRVLVAAQKLSVRLNAASRLPEAEGADALLFLPEAVRLPAQADRAIARALSNSTSPWGCFDVSFRNPSQGPSAALELAAALANWCSRLTGICMWEQAIFVSRSAFFALEGFAVSEERADVEFSRRARQLGAPIVLRERALVEMKERGLRSILRATVRRERRRLAAALGLDPEARRRAPLQ